jgi:uncharacterized protein with PIN domain
MHISHATFYFHGSLNDFLPFAQRDTRFVYNFKGSPAVKDAIEALGVPHPEVSGILVNKSPVNFKYLLQAGDEVEVYPIAAANHLPEDHALVEPVPQPVRFILDVHLGKLAKNLRLLGFDTRYENNYADALIVDLAEIENRVVLTRDVGLLKNSRVKWGYWLRSQFLEEQLKEVIKRYKLQDYFKPFTRCLECNGPILPVEKATVLEVLPPKTKLYFNEFYQCKNCRKVYWKGSHYEKMLAKLGSIS